MGLDTYAGITKFHKDWDSTKDSDKEFQLLKDDLFIGINLCGGMFSGGGSSFRGKVYADYVEWATGESLYTETIEPSTVAVMASDLESALDEWEEFNTPEMNNWGITYDDAVGIAKWFRIAADNGAHVLGWW